MPKMKKFFLLTCLFTHLSFIQGQNTRWELSGQFFSTVNPIFERGEPSLTSIRYYGVRVGATPNLSTDIQLGFRYQQRTDYIESILLTPTTIRRAAQACPRKTLTYESSGFEAELVYRIRSSQFSRLHAFFGGGMAVYIPFQSLHDYDQEIEQIVVSGRNGQVELVECGFPARAFAGSQFAMVFAPGLRLRITHRLHAELETHFRYFPLLGGNGVGGLGLNLVYIFY